MAGLLKRLGVVVGYPFEFPCCDAVVFAVFVYCSGCDVVGGGDLLGGGVVGEFHMVWVLWVDVVAECGFQLLEFAHCVGCPCHGK